MAQTTVAINLEAKTKGTESVKSLKTQIREATNEAVAIAQKFGEFSDEALAAAKRVAELKDQMQDFQQRVQTLNPDKFEAIGKLVGGLANGVQAAQGAMALFGGESEELQKALLKVQGAMAFAQGINGVIEARKQFADFGKDAVAAFGKMTTASKAFLATGIGLLIAGITLVAENFDKIAVSLGFAESEMQKMNKAINNAAASTKQQADDLQYYNSIVQNTKKSEGEREFALKKLKEAGIATDDVNIANANSLTALNDRTKQQIMLIAQRARVEAAAQILQEKTKRLLELQNTDLNQATDLWDKFIVGAKGALFGTNYAANELVNRGLKNLKKAQDDVNLATRVYNDERQKAMPLEGKSIETSMKVESTLQKQKEQQKELNKEHDKRIKHTWNREAVFLGNIKAGLAASEKVDKEAAEKKQKRETAMREYRIEKAFEELEINKKLSQEQIQDEQKKQEAIQQARIAGLQNAANVLGSLGALMKEGSDEAKAFGLLQIAVDTATALTQAQANAMAPTPDNVATGGIAGFAKYAAYVGIILSNVARAKALLKTSSGGTGNVGAAGVPAAPSFAPIGGGALPDEQQFGGMGRVYVLEGDITKTQTRVRRLRNTSVV